MSTRPRKRRLVAPTTSDWSKTGLLSYCFKLIKFKCDFSRWQKEGAGGPMSVGRSGKIHALQQQLSIPVGAAPAKKAEPASPTLLDSSALKARPSRRKLSGTVRRESLGRGSLSAPDLTKDDNAILAAAAAAIVSPRAAQTPGQISMLELKMLALKEKQREKTAAETAPVAAPQQPPVVVVTTPEGLKTGAVDGGERKRRQRKKKVIRRSTEKRSPTSPAKAESEDQEEESSSDAPIGSPGNNSSLSPSQTPPSAGAKSPPSDGTPSSTSVTPGREGAGSDEKKTRRKKKKRPEGAAGSASVAALKAEVEELKAELKREKARREATDQVLSKLLASKKDEAVVLMMAKWQEAMDETVRLRSELSKRRGTK